MQSTSNTGTVFWMRRRQFGCVRRLPSGRYQAFYFHEGSNHRAPQTYETKADANAWLSVQAGDIAKGTWSPGHKLTVSDLADRWLASNPLKRKGSRYRDESILQAHILPVLGSTLVQKVTRPALQKMVDQWAAELSPSTVGRQTSCLAALFSYAVTIGALAQSPATRLRRPHVDPVERPELVADDLERLAKSLGDYALMLWVGAATGMRWAECAGLMIEDFDHNARCLRVERQLDRDGELVPLKTAMAKRTVAIPDWLVTDLSAYTTSHNLTEGLLFRSRQRKASPLQQLATTEWVPACNAAGLSGLDFHDLRSNHATALVDEGVNPKVAQERLGHAQVTTTLAIYARATQLSHRSAAEVIGRRLRPKER